MVNIDHSMVIDGRGGRTTAVRVARAGFLAVVLAASVSGAALVIAPSETGSFFSWGLSPPPLASLIGGLYLASGVTFGVAARLRWQQVRSLLAASVALTAPTLVATLIHLDVFDFGRWQSWAWVALFVAAPPFWTGLLIAGRSDGPPPAPIERENVARDLVLVALAVGFLILGVQIWIDPAAGSAALPMDLSLLGGRFLGSWLAFLAVHLAWLVRYPTDRTLPLVALTAYPAGALIAGLRNAADLGPSTARLAYLAILAGLTVAFGLWLTATLRR